MSVNSLADKFFGFYKQIFNNSLAYRPVIKTISFFWMISVPLSILWALHSGELKYLELSLYTFPFVCWFFFFLFFLDTFRTISVRKLYRRLKYFILRKEDPEIRIKIFVGTPPFFKESKKYTPAENTLIVNLPWAQYESQLREDHKKKKYPASWTKICLKIAKETDQGFIDLIVNNLISVEIIFEEILVLYASSRFIAKGICRVSHEKLLKIFKAEYPSISSIYIEVWKRK